MKKNPENVYVQRLKRQCVKKEESSAISRIFQVQFSGEVSLDKWCICKNYFIDIVPNIYESRSVIYFISGSVEVLNNNVVLNSGDSLIIDNSRDCCTIKALEESIFLFYSYGKTYNLKSYSQHTSLLEDYIYKINRIDHYTYGHSLRVKYLAYDLANYLNNEKINMMSIAMAGLYHDAGKVMVAPEDLTKPGPLTDLQYTNIKKHPVHSYELSKSYLDEYSNKIILQHHERLDGSGYPYGLKGDEILPEAKIIAICDSYDAMTTRHLYTNPKSRDEALEVLRKERGILFEAAYVDAFLGSLQSDEYFQHHVPIESFEEFTAPVIV